MIKRNEFISKYADLNKDSALEAKILELESFVDSELLKSENIINMINQDQVTLNHNELITDSIDNQAVHNDSNILDNGSGRSGGVDDVEFAIWSDTLTNSLNKSAHTTPNENKTLDSNVDGELSVTLPDNTNKNAAKLLVDKYLGPSNISNLTDEEYKNFGFWRKIPILNGTLLDDADAVELLYDNDVKRFKIKFKLNP